MLALAGLLNEEAKGSYIADPLEPKAPHFTPKAKRVVHLFMNGGPSQVDTFDPKPALDKFHGKAIPEGNLRTERKTGAPMRSPFTFKKHGQSGIEVSSLFELTARHIDDMAIIRSMHADVPNHEPSLLLMNCGEGRQPRPSFGSWVTYGLGCENRDLPGFIVLCPGGFPIVTTQNWRSAFLPGIFQGTYLDTKDMAPDKLLPNLPPRGASLAPQRRQLDFAQELNQTHLARAGGDPRLEARIRSFELAFRMQTEAQEVFDLSQESLKTREAYGDTVHGRQLLLTRRLLEKGVRFVQVWSGAGQPWDNHDGLEANHRKLAAEWDRPISAFLYDLKQRGLFDSTLVQWGGEFGRTPVAEFPALNGRDHNHYGFTCWLAGGGVKGGVVHGATDEFGFQAVENRVHVHDLHATMLHLLGFDHTKLTYRHAGRDFRLTDVHGKVVQGLLA
ncbi:MAG: DUF1501 domain-containing protein [Gemmataceae bacterium]|nr:DUF1501 domain-containing protein [Gemmataceae bacterium]